MTAGPSNPTPLALAFYAAFRESGLTLKTVARRAKLSVPTVSAYMNGTRGGSGQRRSRPTITALAQALEMDVDETLSLAGLGRDPGVVQAIRSDPSLSRRDKETLILLYEQQRKRP